jgi:hypothetical protein
MIMKSQPRRSYYFYRVAIPFVYDMRDQSAFRPEPNQSFLPVSFRSVRGPFGRDRTPLTSMALIQPASDFSPTAWTS